MNIHEYQAKEILAKHGVPVPHGRVASNPDSAEQTARELGGACVVKAQIHAGGRGKAGGVKLVKNPEEARDAALGLLGKNLFTAQTGPGGRTVRKVLVEETLAIKQECYVAMTVDRARARVAIMASSEGGTEIEEIAKLAPEKIMIEPIDPAVGLQPFQVRKVAFGLGLPKESLAGSGAVFRGLYDAFMGWDCSLAEVNPLVMLEGGRLVALDAKMSFDPNSLYRHPELADLRDVGEEDPREVEAQKHGLSYIALEGAIGCMVNGAGLAMATMDIIKQHGGEPANFLDVGGGADVEKVREAFKILISDTRVRAILVNIFGGIMRCDVIATGIVAAAREIRLTAPLVVRLEGTNVEGGRQILADSGLPIVSAPTLAEAAARAVAAAAS